VSLTRDDMLNELELLPVWQQRIVSKSVETHQVIPQAATEHVAVIESTLPIKPVEAMPALVVEESGIETAVAVPENLITEEPSVEKTLTDDRPATIMQMDWQGLQSCVSECTACSLAKTRTQTVFGVGDPNADWLIIGEAPGAEEDRKGEPFVGQAGKLLDNMLAAIQLKRGSNVYIANVLKCRPPENRDPHGEEVTQCDPFLKRQVELIKPKLILALGKFAAQSLLDSDNTIASMRGKLHDYHGVPVIVTYHPAYLLRNLQDKARAWEDLCLARKTMANLQSGELPPSI